MSTLALLLALLASASPDALHPPAGDQAPRIDVVLVRHAEAGTEPAADSDLAPEGRARVACLVEALAQPALTHVVTSPAMRTRQTAGPVAERHGLVARVRSPHDASGFAAEIRALPAGSRVLVVGHSNTIPALVAALGGTLEGLVDEHGQPALPRSQHDRLVRLSVSPAGAEPALLSLDDGRQPCH